MHIINHLPTPLLSRQTPFEWLYGKIPSYSHLKVFGCLAYATNVHISHKFAPRVKRCVFLSYPDGQKAYKLYDLATHQVFTSHDVIFHENTFPYESTTSDPSPSQNSAPVIPVVVSDPSPSEPLSTVQQTPSLEPVTSILPLDPHPIPPLSSPTPALRRSQRPHAPPTALCDYICNQVMSPDPLLSSSSGPQKGTRYPLCNFLSYHCYSPQHRSFIATVS